LALRLNEKRTDAGPGEPQLCGLSSFAFGGQVEQTSDDAARTTSAVTRGQSKRLRVLVDGVTLADAGDVIPERLIPG
jgi:hypothetical protein